MVREIIENNGSDSAPSAMKDLPDALLREAESGGQAYDGFAPPVASPDLLIAVALSRRVIGEGYHWHFLTKIHKAHPVTHRVHKMLECPASRAPRGIAFQQTNTKVRERKPL
jgi:hypothetical protein